MIKNVTWFFVVLVMGSVVSLSFRNKSTLTEKLALGEKVPELVLCNESQPLNLRAAEGGYLLLSFWASYDAVSRERNAMLNHAIQGKARVDMISISFDRYRSVFDAAVRQDGIQGSGCYLEIDGENSDAFKVYDLKSGFKNYLIDSKGVIIAKNVTAAELSAYLN